VVSDKEDERQRLLEKQRALLAEKQSLEDRQKALKQQIEVNNT
jgi:hypothetical protein